MRRLPVYLLLDVSGSMRGEAFESARNAVQNLVSSLTQNPFALETVYLSLITFSQTAKVITPLQDLNSFEIPDIQLPESGPTHIGEALEFVCQLMDQEARQNIRDQRKDWRSWLFLLTDGKPSDILKFKLMVDEIKQRPLAGIVACKAGVKSTADYMKRLTDSVFSLDTMDQAFFIGLIEWLSDSTSTESHFKKSNHQTDLPPPPVEDPPGVL